MGMETPQFEQVDVQGQTIHINSTAGLTSTAIAASPQKVISEFWMMNPSTNARDRIIYVSLDGGVNFRSLPWNSEFAWSLKGNVKQIFIKASAAGTLYESIFNIEVD